MGETAGVYISDPPKEGQQILRLNQYKDLDSVSSNCLRYYKVTKTSESSCYVDGLTKPLKLKNVLTFIPSTHSIGTFHPPFDGYDSPLYTFFSHLRNNAP